MLVDVVLAVAFVVLAEVEIRQPWDDGFRAGPVWLNTPLVALLVVPIALRTLAPRLGLALMLLAAVLPTIVVAHTLLFWGGLVPILAMVFTVARRDGGWCGRFTWLAWPLVVLGGLRNVDWTQPSNLLFGMVTMGFAWSGGRVVRRMDARRQALADALERLADAQAAREAEAVAQERGRIAVEMHDVVSHAVSLMVLQVGAARMELLAAASRRSSCWPPNGPGGRRSTSSAGRWACSAGARREGPDVRGLLGRVPPLYVDVALGLVFTVVGVLEPPMLTVDGFDAGPAWLATVIGVFMGVPLVLRRRAPAACLLVMCAALGLSGLVVAHGDYFWSQLLPLCFAVYPAARLLDGVLGRWGWLLALLAVETDVVHSATARSDGGPWLPLVVFGGVAVAGRLARRSAGEAVRLASTLARLAEQQTAREEAAVSDERARIAAEVHDVVAHAVSVMVLQVGAARLGLEQHGGDVPEQLRAAETTGRDALSELRCSLGLLRDREEKGPLQPLPGLDDVAALTDRFRTAGLDVGVELGELGDLPAGLQLSVYRLVQEGLTNALKHAGRVRVTGAVRRVGEDVHVELTNPEGDRVAPAIPSGGHGLLGMRERVAMYGGGLDAGPGEGGFTVHARLPVPAVPDEVAAPRVVSS